MYDEVYRNHVSVIYVTVTVKVYGPSQSQAFVFVCLFYTCMLQLRVNKCSLQVPDD